jgi:hypothetical protein
MRRRRSSGFTLWTSTNATGSYRGWEHAVGSARWLAEQTSGPVYLVSDDSGASWDVAPEGGVTPHAVG